MAERTIVSPYPGTFYRRPSPDQDPFVAEGAQVSAGDTVGLVEIMKNFHEVKADADGVAVRFLVDDDDLVEAGQDVLVIDG